MFPTSSFRPEPCGARRSGETSSPLAGRFLHCAPDGAPVEMTRGCAWGWEVSPLRASGPADGPPLVISTGAVRSTAEWRNLVPTGREVSPLRACGAPVEMTRGCAWGWEVSPLRASGPADGPPPSSFRPEPCGARRSGETSSPLAGRFLHSAPDGAPVEMTGGCALGWEVSPLRASALRSMGPHSSFRPEPCGARRSGETSSPLAGRFLHSAPDGAPVEMTGGCALGWEVSPLRASALRSMGPHSSFRPEPCGARRSGETSSPLAGRFLHCAPDGAPVEMTGGCALGWEVSPLRAPARPMGPPSSFRPEPCAARRSGETSSPLAGRFLHCAPDGAPVEMTARGHGGHGGRVP